MKSPILAVPSLMLFGFAYLLSMQTPQPTVDATANPQHRIQEIRQQLRTCSERLDQLEAQTHHVLPRGGLSQAPPVVRAPDWQVEVARHCPS